MLGKFVEVSVKHCHRRLVQAFGVQLDHINTIAVGRTNNRNVYICRDIASLIATAFTNCIYIAISRLVSGEPNICYRFIRSFLRVRCTINSDKCGGCNFG
ncbi:hypothetical protein D3C81_1119000 [compost metagenome]